MENEIINIEGSRTFEGITEEVKDDVSLWLKERFKYRRGGWIKIKIEVINED